MARRPRGKSRERVFSFMKDRLEQGEPPSVREVQAALGFSAVESARAHLDALVLEGRLEKVAGRSRGYRLPERAGRARLQRVPVLGRVQAGALTAAIEDPEGYLYIEARSSEEELFALRVRGESMTGAGILPGDLVIVRRQPWAAAGDVVVALVADEATVKTLRFVKGRPSLCPENPAFAPLVLDEGEELSLLGKVIEVRRHLEPSLAPHLVEEGAE